MRIAMVCARAGSEGLLRKNVRPLGGRPLIEWTLEVVADSPIDLCFISTDLPRDSFTIPTALRDVCWLQERPRDLCGGHISKLEVWQHLLSRAERLGYNPTLMVDFDVTRPFKTAIDAHRLIFELEAHAYGAAMTVAKARKSPYFDLLEVSKYDTLRLAIEPDPPLTGRQFGPCLWEHAGIYAFTPEALAGRRSLYAGGMYGVQVPPVCAITIDDALDWAIVEGLWPTYGPRAKARTVTTPMQASEAIRALTKAVDSYINPEVRETPDQHAA